MKTYTIIIQKNGNSREVSGNLQELQKHFSYTLDVGYSWNKKINTNPKTINTFVKNLQMSYEEQEAQCFNRTIVTLK